MRLLELLKQEQKDKRLHDSEEYHFFLANRHLLTDCNCFLDLYNIEDDFALVKANIVLKSILNKMAIEARLQDLSEQSLRTFGRIRHHDIRSKMLDQPLNLPYCLDNDTRIYVPIFNRAMNYIYAHEPDKLCDFPYKKLAEEFTASIINPFETYHFFLFDSNFTRLIKIASDRTSTAFYHLDFRNILIINAQGGLDLKIALFDRFMKDPDYEGIIDRIKPVVAALFANDRDMMVNQLLDNRLVSPTIVDKWLDALTKSERKKYRL
jgi:hypothetical protein